MPLLSLLCHPCFAWNGLQGLRLHPFNPTSPAAASLYKAAQTCTGPSPSLITVQGRRTCLLKLVGLWKIHEDMLQAFNMSTIQQEEGAVVADSSH